MRRTPVTFYRFSQRLTHGYLLPPARSIFIEGDKAEDARKEALKVDGVYHDPDLLFDCNCCGTRWPMWATFFRDYGVIDELQQRLQFVPAQWLAEDTVPEALVQFKNGRTFMIENMDDVAELEAYLDKLKNDMFPEV